jgi:lipopolysaccharide biosynthesis protein
MYRYTLTVDDVNEMIPPYISSLCLFATYSKLDTIDGDTLNYINEVSKYFNRVIVLTNDDRTVTNKERLSKNCIVCQVPNQCLDFGMYWQILRFTKLEYIKKLALINDSCYMIGNLLSIFNKGSCISKGFWGITKSFEIQEHLQSYFLVFDTRHAIDKLLDFVSIMDIADFYNKDKMNIVVEFEVMLSHHISSCGIEMKEIYTRELLLRLPVYLPYKGENPSYYLWERLVTIGCPIIKKKRALV